ncbi:hypothetical protein ACRALDRAFT_1081282 [Sodiomyces alcalophilus JCM 7366]|uniref:uncharacterized protein n=1 Tax=Sodiomyces alcalophilus JCM 7366 TaxID=591952 RepID=UPI0039B6A7B3
MGRNEGQGTRDGSHPRQTRVAIVGTGLAGLTTAYLLHNDDQKRYAVTLFEQSDRLSFDSASVAVRNEETGSVERVDLPMRASAGGYYANLMRMYSHLSIPLHPVRFLFVFAKMLSTPASSHPPPARRHNPETSAPGTYFVHASNLHQTPPPWPGSRPVLLHLLEVLYLIVCQFWFTVACFLVAPRPSESLRSYLSRVWLPRRYVSHYLLPLMSSVSTCSHDEMLAFPASDVVAYKRLSHGQQHYAVCGGVRQVQARLAAGLRDVRLGARVVEVVPRGVEGEVVGKTGMKGSAGVTVRWRPVNKQWDAGKDSDEGEEEETFDRVVLAVSPDVTARIFHPLRSTLAQLPTVRVESSILRPKIPTAESEGSRPETHRLIGESDRDNDGEKDGDAAGASKGCMHHLFGTDTSPPPQSITFRTRFSETGSRTEALHAMPSGVVVSTCPFDPDAERKRTLQTARFTRTLRTVQSRVVVQRMLGDVDGGSAAEWVNGEDDVWVTGAWCWDGMVLLEGCIVSAMRVARDFGVRIPWETR